MSGPPLYDYDSASILSHYAPRTIANYCDRGILVPGVDFVIRTYRTGRLQRWIRLITPHGIATLIARQMSRNAQGYGRARRETSHSATRQGLDH